MHPTTLQNVTRGVYRPIAPLPSAYAHAAQAPKQKGKIKGSTRKKKRVEPLEDELEYADDEWYNSSSTGRTTFFQQVEALPAKRRPKG